MDDAEYDQQVKPAGYENVLTAPPAAGAHVQATPSASPSGVAYAPPPVAPAGATFAPPAAALPGVAYAAPAAASPGVGYAPPAPSAGVAYAHPAPSPGVAYAHPGAGLPGVAYAPPAGFPSGVTQEIPPVVTPPVTLGAPAQTLRPRAAPRESAEPDGAARDSAAFPLSTPLSGLAPREVGRRRATGPLDWSALALAILVPPLGFLVAIVALIVGARRNGWGAAVSKAAVAVSLVLSLALAGGAVVVSRSLAEKAAVDSVIASSSKWCAVVRKDPAILQSQTFGWPDSADTVAASIVRMQRYERFWRNAASVAPAGIQADTTRIADTAKQVIASVSASRVIDAQGNSAQIQQAVAASSIPNWVSQNCR
ncbi:MAG: hypothetical protein JWM02_3597 [Frankiales bacterium]|nr:hypothetical protein [Frankiales bacterium]